MDFYITWIKEFLKKHGLKNGVNFAPHDIKVHEWSNGRSRVDQAAAQGFFFKAVPDIGIMDGINCTRAIFPHLIFHADNCRLGLGSLKQYEKDEDGKPIHNFASHPADALRTFGVGWHDSYASQTLLRTFTMEKWMPT